MTVHADQALLIARPLKDNGEGWTEEALERVEWVLPTLIEAGYARTDELGSPPTRVWALTERAVNRWCELRRERRRYAFSSFRRFRQLEERSEAALGSEAAAAFVLYMKAHALSDAKELNDRACPEAAEWTMRVPRRWRTWPPPP
jgi:hypothetical protein